MVANGVLDANGVPWWASEILVKHDEKYMPPEVKRDSSGNAAPQAASN